MRKGTLRLFPGLPRRSFFSWAAFFGGIFFLRRVRETDRGRDWNTKRKGGRRTARKGSSLGARKTIGDRQRKQKFFPLKSKSISKKLKFGGSYSKELIGVHKSRTSHHNRRMCNSFVNWFRHKNINFGMYILIKGSPTSSEVGSFCENSCSTPIVYDRRREAPSLTVIDRQITRIMPNTHQTIHKMRM